MLLKAGISALCVVASLFVCYVEPVEPNVKNKVRYLESDYILEYEPFARHRGFFEKDLNIYCHVGSPKTIARMFESTELILDIEGDDYDQYDGITADEVRQHYEEHLSLFSFTLFSQKRKRLQLPPFEQQCIGIETVHPYRIHVERLRIDFWRVLQLVVGVVVFLYAGILSHNSIFYYITGIALGMCSSFMLLIWLSSKLMPRRTMMYGVLIGGWTVGMYLLQLLWDNLQVIVVTYRTYVFWYMLVTGLISFFICYRWGPPSNARSKNIVKWLLQIMSVVLMFFSSRHEEAAIAFILVTVVFYYFPRPLLNNIRSVCYRRFPPRRRLLTEKEYREESVRETKKALEELRSYAKSPDCKQWRTMTKLRDPYRFAAFVEGASHLRDEELLYFESTKYDDEIDETDLSEHSEDDDRSEQEEVENSEVEEAEEELPYIKSPSGNDTTYRRNKYQSNYNSRDMNYERFDDSNNQRRSYSHRSPALNNSGNRANSSENISSRPRKSNVSTIRHGSSFERQRVYSAHRTTSPNNHYRGRPSLEVQDYNGESDDNRY